MDFRERQETRRGEREKHRCVCSTHSFTRWLAPVSTPTGDGAQNLGTAGWVSDQVSCPARALLERFIVLVNESQN